MGRETVNHPPNPQIYLNSYGGSFQQEVVAMTMVGAALHVFPAEQ